ncbi:MAG: hypothetical protein MI919_23745, partial [Holophagales bacterium]|nr:hypothetical protein [Holophagales bacterium]
APEAIATPLVIGMPIRNGDAGHFYVFRRALLSLESEQPGGRRRLRVFEADSELTLGEEEGPVARALLELGCACRALPRPSRRDVLVRLVRPTSVAGAEMQAGQVAAVDFDPGSVLPELRGLGLFPWEVMEIEPDPEEPRAAGAGTLPPWCGPALDTVRLVVRLEESWLHPVAGSFLAGLHVDMAYGDYRLHPPRGFVSRAYPPGERSRPPFAVFGPR